MQPGAACEHVLRSPPPMMDAAVTLPPGRIKDAPEDFRVDEIPLYEPSGEGPHLYLHIEKRNLTTDEVVLALARLLEVPPREVGVAGLKDKVAVTTQRLSFPVPNAGKAGAAEAFLARARDVAMPGLTILDARLHANKLKTGHLAGNAFTIVVRGVPRAR